MNTPLIYEHTIDFKGRKFLFTETFSSDFSSLKKAKQSLGVVLNDKNEVLLASEDEKFWTLPGGTIEEGETPEQTVVREVYEETGVAIDPKSVKPFFYNIAQEIIGNEFVYEATQLRFLARVLRVDKFLGDPGGNMQFRKFVPIDELDKHLGWPGTNEIIKDKLNELLKI